MASSEVVGDTGKVDWDSFNKMCSDKSSLEDITFGSKHWASIYLASTPQQAAELGLKFPGVDEVSMTSLESCLVPIIFHSVLN